MFSLRKITKLAAKRTKTKKKNRVNDREELENAIKKVVLEHQVSLLEDISTLLDKAFEEQEIKTDFESDTKASWDVKKPLSYYCDSGSETEDSDSDTDPEDPDYVPSYPKASPIVVVSDEDSDDEFMEPSSEVYFRDTVIIEPRYDILLPNESYKMCEPGIIFKSGPKGDHYDITFYKGTQFEGGEICSRGETIRTHGFTFSKEDTQYRVLSHKIKRGKLYYEVQKIDDIVFNLEHTPRLNKHVKRAINAYWSKLLKKNK